MADFRNGAFQRRTGFVDDVSIPGENGPAARAALIIAFIGHRDMIIAQPGDTIGFAQDALSGAVKAQTPVALHIDSIKVGRPGRKVAGHGSVRADDDNMVVFLHRDGDFARVIDGNELRLGIVAGNFGQTRHLDPLQGGAICGALHQRQLHHKAGGHLRHRTVIQLFVALVLDRDGQKGRILGHGNRVGLPAKIAFRDDGFRCQIHRHQLARRIGKAFAGHHGRKHLAAMDFRCRRLTADGDIAKRFGGSRIGDVDQPDHAQRAVGIDQGHPVFRRGDDFRTGRA